MAEIGPTPIERTAFQLFTFQNPGAKRRLVKQRVETGDFFRMSAADLEKTGFTPEQIRQIKNQPFAAAEREIVLSRKNGVRMIFKEEDDYPPLLREIFDPPEYLYCLGDAKLLAGEKLAVVGSRQASPYGSAALKRLLPEVCRAGLAVVSGMAYGIDSQAHRLALAEGGGTIGVNAGGLLRLYPAGNRALTDRLREHGSIISEFPLEVISRPFFFPVRNRIIAGISRAVLVVEAAARSGSLITARLALEQNRDVLAVPGNIDSPLSRGTNWLIQQGAKAVLTAQDILDEFGMKASREALIEPPLNALEKKILDLLGENEVKDSDYFVEKLNLSTAEVLSALMGLTMQNLLVEGSGGYKKAYHG